MRTDSIKAILKKAPLILLFYLASGFFLRWYQLRNELLYDGSLVEGAIMHRVLFLLPVTLIFGFGFLVYGLENIATHKNAFSKGALPYSAQLVAGVLMFAGNLLHLSYPADLSMVYTPVSVVMIRYLPYLGLLSGVMFILFATKTRSGKTPSPLLYMAVSVYLVVRLIVNFQTWNMDPSIHDYAFKLLGSIAAMLSCFQIAGFSFGKGKRRITIIWCICAAFFTAVSIPDYMIAHGIITFYYAGVSGFVRDQLPDLLVNSSLLLLTLTHGLQLIFAPDPIEDIPSEEVTPEFSLEDPQ